MREIIISHLLFIFLSEIKQFSDLLSRLHITFTYNYSKPSLSYIINFVSKLFPVFSSLLFGFNGIARKTGLSLALTCGFSYASCMFFDQPNALSSAFICGESMASSRWLGQGEEGWWAGAGSRGQGTIPIWNLIFLRKMCKGNLEGILFLKFCPVFLSV